MILAVVPARMGSQRMPRKNLCEIEPGTNLVQHAVNCARWSGLVDHVVISSDEEVFSTGAKFSRRPFDLSGPTSDISAAVEYATRDMERTFKCRYDYVLTLQPAVLARSPLIVRRLIDAVVPARLNGGLTMAYTHRWIWEVGEETASNDWHGGPYPRSQDSCRRFVEINAAQIASRSVVERKERWGTPLAILELPAWSASLDIDTPEDLETARDMWSWAKPRLETWTGPVHVVQEVKRCA